MPKKLTDKIQLTLEELSRVTNLSDHSVLQNHITCLRDKTTDRKTFHSALYNATMIIGGRATEKLEMTTCSIDTPIENIPNAPILANNGPVVASVLRAGNGMQDAMMNLIGDCSGAHIGLERDHETLEAVPYCFKVPSDISNREVIMVDPMLATANSSIMAAEKLRSAGVVKIRFACLVAAPYGIRKFRAAFPDVHIYTGAIDRQLNEKGYIMPGLGDAGDRLYGTV